MIMAEIEIPSEKTRGGSNANYKEQKPNFNDAKTSPSPYLPCVEKRHHASPKKGKI